MNKIIGVSILTLTTLTLASCTNQAPLTEAQQAEKYNMSALEFQETKEAAARMNMTLEDHMKMTDTEMEEMNHMDMGDDSHMIEDDMEMETIDDSKEHMEKMHKDSDVQDHTSDEHM